MISTISAHAKRRLWTERRSNLLFHAFHAIIVASAGAAHNCCLTNPPRSASLAGLILDRRTQFCPTRKTRSSFATIPLVFRNRSHSFMRPLAGEAMRRYRNVIRLSLVAMLIVGMGSAIANTDGNIADGPAVMKLQRQLDAVERDFELFQQQLLAANTAADPSVRAAAVVQATDTLARLAIECRDTERLYAALEGSLPTKAGKSGSKVLSDLAAITADLEAAAKDLESARSTIASLR